jgi:hypothetical protein
MGKGEQRMTIEGEGEGEERDRFQRQRRQVTGSGLKAQRA